MRGIITNFHFVLPPCKQNHAHCDHAHQYKSYLIIGCAKDLTISVSPLTTAVSLSTRQGGRKTRCNETPPLMPRYVRWNFQ